MRAIIVKYDDTIQAVCVVNADDAEALSNLILARAAKTGDKLWQINSYAIDPVEQVLQYCFA